MFFSATDNNGNGTTVGVAYFHMPVLVGLNVSKSVSIVASPGFVYALTSASVTSGGNTSTVTGGVSGFLGRLGAGVNFRVSKKFSVQPELTFMRAFDSSSALMWMGGVGFNIGAQPDYSDLDTDGSSAPAAAPPAQ